MLAHAPLKKNKVKHSLRSIDNSQLPVKIPKAYRLNDHILGRQKPPSEFLEKSKEVPPDESASLDSVSFDFEKLYRTPLGDRFKIVVPVHTERTVHSKEEKEPYHIKPLEVYPADREVIAITQEGVKDLILEYQETTRCISGKKASENKRGKITAYTPEARKRHILTLRNCAERLQSLVTLTYPEDFPTDCKTAMKHLDRFEKRLSRRGYKSIWTKEFQERGAVHFHIGIDGMINRKEIAQMWYECVGSQDERHLKAGTTVQWLVPDGDPRIEPDRRRVNEEKRRGNRNAKRNYIAYDEFIRYMITYLKKLTQKVVPSYIQNVGKFWDCSNALSCKNTMPVRQRIKMTYREYMAKTRLFRRWLQARYRSWGIFKWKMRAKKTIVYDGVRLLDELRLRYQPF